MLIIKPRLFLLLLITILPAFSQSPGNAARLRELEAAHLSTDERIAACEKLFQQSPEDPRVEAGLAEAFIQKLRETTDFTYLNRAAALVDKMLHADARNYAAIRLSIQIETNRHNFPKAAQLAKELIERDPSDTGSLGLLGDSLMEQGQYAAAADVYRKMLELGPNLASYNRIAYQRFVTGSSTEALAWMNLAVQAGSRTPENLAWCLVEFGDMLFKTGHVDDAFTAYNRALDTLPRYHRAYAALGRFYAAAGQYRQAVENFKRAQDVVPLPDYAAALVPLYAQLGDSVDMARQKELLDVIDQLGQANGEKGNRMLAIAYADQNRSLGRALELIEDELPTRNDVYTYDALSWVLFRNGRQKEAEDASAKATACKTAEPLFLYHAGVIEMAGGKTADGKQKLRQALALNPHFAFPQADDARRLLGDVEAAATR